VFRSPLSLRAAGDLLAAFTETERVETLQPAPNAWKRISKLAVRDPALRGNEVFDALIAQTCLDHGVHRLWTLDAGFARLKAIEIYDPS
jgi:predicted nucleic acid-binding protein